MFIHKNVQTFINYIINTKEQLQKKLVKDLSEEVNNKNQQYGCEQYKNLPEDEKQNLVDYRKNIIKYENIKLLQK